MLAKNERLAQLRTHYDDATCVLIIRSGGKEVARGDLGTAEGRKAIEDFFSIYSADDLNGPPKLLEAPGHSFSDDVEKVVSIINLASVAAIETEIGVPVHPLRFRANLYIAGWPAWHEFDLMDKEISIGDKVRLRIFKRTVRCPATNVDPDTGIRDLTIPQDLKKMLGHMDCGIFGKVVAPGRIMPGDSVK